MVNSKNLCTFAVHFPSERKAMIDRSLHMIFEPSGMPVPTEEEVRFEAREIVQRSGWGLPLIERLHRMADPYWREAVTRCLMDKWRELVRDKDERTYYYDSDGDVRYSWTDAEYDFNRIIRNSTAEQVEAEENNQPSHATSTKERECEAVQVTTPRTQIVNNYYINTHNGPIITDSNVTLH